MKFECARVRGETGRAVAVQNLYTVPQREREGDIVIIVPVISLEGAGKGEGGDEQGQEGHGVHLVTTQHLCSSHHYVVVVYHVTIEEVGLSLLKNF